jgi:predicted transcriptional regulator
MPLPLAEVTHGLEPSGDLAVGTLTRLEAGSTDPSWSSVRAIDEALKLSMVQLGRMVEANGD